MKWRMCAAVLLVGASLAGSAPGAAAQQPAAPVMPSSPQSEATKLLLAAMQEKDPAKRVVALEAFIRDNPGSPMLSTAYSGLLATLRISDIDKAGKVAEDLLARYPDPNSPIRRTAYSSKFSILRVQKKTGEIHVLAQRILDEESDPAILVNAATMDQELAAKLFEKAIAERQKDENAVRPPTMDDIRWQYGQSLISAGRKDEGLKLAQSVLDAAAKDIAATEALPADDPQRRRAELLRRTLSSRSQTLSATLAAAGDYQKAIEYLDLSAPKDPMSALESRPSIEMRRAEIYQKMRKPDLQMDCYAKAYAARMDESTRNRILELAKKTGRNPEKVFALARKMRKADALPIKPFELKSIEGKVTTLASVKSKVTLINFFFPT